MSPSKRQQTPIRFTAQMRERLDAEVARTGLSINTIVHQALDRYLPALSEQAKATPPAPAPPAPAGGDVLDWE